MNLKGRLVKLEDAHATANKESLAVRLMRARTEYQRGERKPLSDSELREIANRIRGRGPSLGSVQGA